MKKFPQRSVHAFAVLFAAALLCYLISFIIAYWKEPHGRWDAWLIWNIWQVANPTLADVVALEPDYRIYRDTAVVATRRGKGNPHAAGFIAFLGSAEGARIFRKAGWITP